MSATTAVSDPQGAASTGRMRRPADAILRISEDEALAAAVVDETLPEAHRDADAGSNSGADSNADAIATAGGNSDDGPMLINMGPQHPSTHGVLRIAMELQGETVLRSKPIIGYLHPGMEKTAEDLTYLQGPTNVTRMDYASPLFNELVFCLAVEDLLGAEIPERATWIRMLMCELNRMSSHLLFLATNGMDLGAVGMMLYGMMFMVLQFGALFYMLGRGRVYWVQPGETGVYFSDYRGNDQVLEVARRVVRLLQGAISFKRMGGEVR